LTAIKVGLVVEGHGDVKAVPILIRRVGTAIDPGVTLDIQQPIRRPRSSLVRGGIELERAVELAALKVRPRGGVFVLLDSDDACPAQLGPQLLQRANQVAMDLPVSIILPKCEFECWFLAAADSIRGKRGLPADLTAPHNPEDVRGAKEWLRQRMQGHFYSETIDQPALTAIFDLTLARNSRSFDRCYRALNRLIDHFRE